MDLESIGTGLTILGASQVTKDSVQRILAPTADYIGAGLLTSTKASVNLARVLAHAAKRLGRRRNDAGSIPPRVLKSVLDEAPFIEDELTAAYYGGILAAAWSDQPQDDRAMAHLATINRLSNYSIKLHCLVYHSLYRLHQVAGEGERFGIFVPMTSYHSWVGFDDSEDQMRCLAHSVVNLEREDLAQFPMTGNARWLADTKLSRKLRRSGWEWPEGGGILASPTVLGGELFLWAHGYRDYYIYDLFDTPDLSFGIEGAPIPDDATPVPIVWKSRTR
jgi:hypothetical protein